MSCVSLDDVIANQVKNGPAALRDSLSKEFPEIDSVCSDAYLANVLTVANRTFDYARDEKIRKSLQWRRDHGVERLCSRFSYNRLTGVLDLTPASNEAEPGLLKVCHSRALQILPGRDQDGRIALFAETRLLDWQAVGVEAALQYHILIIEAALNMIRSDAGRSPESFVLFVDPSGPMLATPPPLAGLQGLVSLLQKAYPDRIHRIEIGPVNFMVRGLYQMIKPLMSQSTQKKIKMSGKGIPPAQCVAAQFSAHRAEQQVSIADHCPKQASATVALDQPPRLQKVVTDTHADADVRVALAAKDEHASGCECSTEASEGDRSDSDPLDSEGTAALDAPMYAIHEQKLNIPKEQALPAPSLSFLQCCGQRHEEELELCVPEVSRKQIVSL